MKNWIFFLQSFVSCSDVPWGDRSEKRQSDPPASDMNLYIHTYKSDLIRCVKSYITALAWQARRDFYFKKLKVVLKTTIVTAVDSSNCSTQ